MAKNHYVSQLIIRRFSSAINTFDTESKRLVRDRKSHNVFYKKDLYSDDVEKQMAEELENPFARLIDGKIICKEKIVLTREELYLIKRFLLIDSIRTYDAAGFYEIISRFKAATERYAQFSKLLDKIDLMRMPSITEKKEDKQTLYMQAMTLFLDCHSASEMIFHPYVTRELYCWSKSFLDAFLTFWDSADNQEFILTDNGMSSEYEPSHVLFGGLDISKLSYLLHKSEDKSLGDARRTQYSLLLAKHQITYENFNIFSLSATRSIVLANPFFRLYHGKQKIFYYTGERDELQFDAPDIWPTCFETKAIVAIPDTQYKVEGRFSPDDVFTYTPCKLSVFDTIHVNILALNQRHRIIGFNDIDKVIDSFGVASMMDVVNRADIYGNDGLENLRKFVHHIIADEYNYIFKEYKGKKWQAGVNPFEYLDAYAYKTYRDIQGNRYVLEYLLAHEDMVRTMDKNFGFMGPPDKRIEDIKFFLKELKKKTQYALRDDIYSIAEFLHNSWQAEYRQIVSDEYLDTMTIDARHKGLLTRFDEKSWDFLMLLDDGKLIGVVLFGKSFTEGYLDDGEIPAIYLQSDYVGKGCGHRLFSEAEQALISKGYKNFILDVLSENKRAVQFYLIHGYKVVDNREVQLGEKKYPLTVMRKQMAI